MPIDKPELYYDAFDVARILRIHYKTVRKWGVSGRLPSFKIGGRRYYLREDIDNLEKQYRR